MMFFPESAQDVADIFHGHGSFAVRGSDTKAIFASDTESDSIIKTTKMAGIVEWSPDDLVVTVKAGTPVEELNEELKTRNQQIAIPTAATGMGRLTAGLPGTVGGLVAANLPTRWEAYVKGPRYWTLGMTLVRSSAEIVRCGSKVVKNVAGYDVQKLLVGSWGQLGVITDVTLRTMPAKTYDEEPQDHAWDGSPPFVIARTLPTDVDEFLKANDIQAAFADYTTGTVWAQCDRVTTPPRDGWILSTNERSPRNNTDLAEKIKNVFDPVGRLR